MARTVTVILSLLALFNWYAGYTIISRSAWAETHAATAWLIVFGFFVLQLAGPFGDRLLFAGLRQRVAARLFVSVVDWLSYLSFGVLSCLMFYGLIAGIVTTAWQIAVPPLNPAQFDHNTLLILGTVTAATVLLGLVQARGTPASTKSM